jgi:tetraacyldisaccharide 4'-kinase
LQLGDEPFQFYQKFKNIQVAVDAERKNGIEQLLSQSNPPEIILLDDAYQHRKVKAGLYVVLTSYGDLYCDDFMLPTGNLRESRKGVKRAAIVVVTKCPSNLSIEEQNTIKKRLKLSSNQSLFFTFIAYDDKVYSDKQILKVKEITNQNKILLAGIAKPESFFMYLKQGNEECLTFPDHHHFSENDLKEIKEKAKNKLIITTEKDYVRLKGSILSDQLYYLPIKSSFLIDSDQFDKNILNYVGQSTRNR